MDECGESALSAIGINSKGRCAEEGSAGDGLGARPTPTITRLKSRTEFLATAKGASVSRGAVVIQILHRVDGSTHVGEGFTATKKIGNAVARNRAKRRLREAARALLPLHGVPGGDYVFIARMGAGERPWPRLLDDVRTALIGLAAGRDEPRPPRRPKGAPRKPAAKPPKSRALTSEPSSPDG